MGVPARQANTSEHDAVGMMANAIDGAAKRAMLAKLDEGCASWYAANDRKHTRADKRASTRVPIEPKNIDSKGLLAVVRRAIAVQEAAVVREEARLNDASEHLLGSWTGGLATVVQVEAGAAVEMAEVLEPMYDLVQETHERTMGGRPQEGEALNRMAAARANIAVTLREATELVAITESLASTSDKMEVLASKVVMDVENTGVSDAMYELTSRTIKYLKTSDVLGRLLEQPS